MAHDSGEKEHFARVGTAGCMPTPARKTVDKTLFVIQDIAFGWIVLLHLQNMALLQRI